MGYDIISVIISFFQYLVRVCVQRDGVMRDV